MFFLCLLIMMMMMISMTYSKVIVKDSNGQIVEFDDSISPAYSRFIGPQADSELCILVDAPVLFQDIDLCSSLILNENKKFQGKFLISNQWEQGFTGSCTTEKRYKNAIALGFVGIASLAPGTPGLQLNAHDGNYGNDVKQNAMPFLSLSESLKKYSSKISTISILECDESPWKSYFDGVAWKAINNVNGISYFLLFVFSANNMMKFVKVYNARKNPEYGQDIVDIIVILALNSIGALCLGIVFSLGFALSTPILPQNWASAFNTMCSGIATVPLYYNALYLREYYGAVEKLKKPKSIFKQYPIQIFICTLLLFGVDSAKFAASIAYVRISTSVVTGCYMLANFVIALIFLYYSRRFIVASGRVINIGDDLFSRCFQVTKRAVISRRIDHENNSHDQASKKISSSNDENIAKFFKQMHFWLNVCAFFQFSWIALLPLIITGIAFTPNGNLLFAGLMCTARFMTPFSQVMALRPKHRKSSSSSGKSSKPTSSKNQAVALATIRAVEEANESKKSDEHVLPQGFASKHTGSAASVTSEALPRQLSKKSLSKSSMMIEMNLTTNQKPIAVATTSTEPNFGIENVVEVVDD